MSKRQQPSRQVFPVAGSACWLVLALVLVFVQALPTVSYPIGRDQATYAVIGRGLLHGARLYRDLWDNKPPGIFYIYAFIVKTFGAAMWSVGLLNILWLLAISFCIFRFTEPTLGSVTALLAVQANAAMHIRAGYWDAGQPETFVTLFIFGSYFLLADCRPGSNLRRAGAGILFGAAFWVKYNAVAFLPFLLFVLYWQIKDPGGLTKRIRRAGTWRGWFSKASWFAIGFTIACAAFVSHLLFSGAWNSFVEEQFQVLPRYAATAFDGIPHYWWWAAGRIDFWLGFWTVCAAFAAIVIAWKRNQLPNLAPALLGAGCGFAGLAAQIRYQPYYFETCYPFFAIFWAYLAIQMWEGARFLARWFMKRNWHVARVLIWIVLVNVVALCLPRPAMRMVTNYRAFDRWRQNSREFYSTYPWPGAVEDFRDVLKVTDFLKRHPTSSSGVYVWGNEPLIYFLSRHRPPVRFVWNLALIAPWRLPDWRRELIRQLSEKPPRFIVVARDDEIHGLSGTYEDSAHALREFPALARFVDDFYQPCQDDVTFEIYCRTARLVAESSTGPPS